jgi:hypothetical protein
MPASGPYIVGKKFDALFFLLSPAVALAFALLVHFGFSRITTQGTEADSLVTLYVIIPLTVGHQMTTFLRSHTHREFWSEFPVRLSVFPVALVLALWASDAMFVTAVLLAGLWQVYHYAAQNFGLARIYEVRSGGDPLRFRRLDLALSIYLYSVPYIAVTQLAAELAGWGRIRTDLGADAIDALPLTSAANDLGWALIVLGSVIPIRYYVEIQRARKDGYTVPWTKALLFGNLFLAVTVSLLVSPVIGVLTATVLHSIQYYAIVNRMEKNAITRAPLLLAFGWACGALADHSFRTAHDTTLFRYGYAVVIALTLLHFYYDGFIWSVRKRQVA